MANKLRKIFSNEMVSLNGKINFKDYESYKGFLGALKTVSNKGKTVNIEGVTSLKTEIQNGTSVYPFMKHENPDMVTIGPSKEKVPFKLNTKFGERMLIFNRHYMDGKVILQTPENGILYLKLNFDQDAHTVTFAYQIQLKVAQNIGEIIENCDIALAFLDLAFKQNDVDESDKIAMEELTLLREAKDYFAKIGSFYKKLEFIGREYALTFNPAVVVLDTENWIKVEEIYILLKEKRAVRLNAKLTETTDTAMDIAQPIRQVKLGSAIDVTFINYVTYSLWEQQVTLYKANLLSNAVVKKIEDLPSGKVKIYYGEKEYKPMYISYRGFKTEEEAEEEVRAIMSHKNIYVEAPLLSDYINHDNAGCK